MFESYIQKFNNNDTEYVIQLISNEKSLDFLLQNAPRLYCPDEIIEETFAFRTWTIRKHLRNTDNGIVMTEFLNDVPWADKYNTINAPLFHHLNEYRYFKNADCLLSYIRHFIENIGGNAYQYSTPALTAIYEFLKYTGNENLISSNAQKLEAYFNTWEEKHLCENGLYWSFDNYDAMELSISGTIPDPDAHKIYEDWINGCNPPCISEKILKGLRPTLNAYMYGDAVTLSKIFELVGNHEKSDYYRIKALKIQSLVNEKLWDGDFYKAIHSEDINNDLSFKDLSPERNVRELIAYNLWSYCLPSEDKATMFKYLKDDKVFKSPAGFTTADQSHPLFLYTHPHECLWNGYVWPYATSQALNGVIALLNNYNQDVINNHDLYEFIKVYAQMHYIDIDGKKINWIDEVMHPYPRRWYARDILKKLGNPQTMGGLERGKDYNHSTFIDLVLRGLVGIDTDADTLTVKPRIKGIWKWFKVENISYKKQTYDIYYDEDGSKYNKGIGLIIERHST